MDAVDLDNSSSGVSDELDFADEDDDHGPSVEETADDDQDDLPQQLVQKDDKAVKLARWVVLIVLLSSAILNTGFFYYYLRSSERNAFKSEFDKIATKVVAPLTHNVHKRMASTHTVAQSVQAVMKASGSSNLNLTVPEWSGITQTALYYVKNYMVAWSPILQTTEETAKFESHVGKTLAGQEDQRPCYLCGDPRFGFTNPEKTVEFPGASLFYECGEIDLTTRGGVTEEQCSIASDVVEGECVCGTEPMYEMGDVEGSTAEGIFRIENGQVVNETGPGPYAPIWQVTSWRQNNNQNDPRLWNQYSDPIRARALEMMKESRLPVISETFIREGAFYDMYASFEGIPGAIVFFPVFDGIGDIVGTITGEFSWAEFVSDSFPTNSEYVQIVIENSCGQNHTYTIDPETSNLVHLGKGDRHDRSYDDMVHSSSFEDYEGLVMLTSKAGKPHSELDYCRYRFSVFATAELEEQYTSRTPFIYSAVVAARFLFTVVVFLAYDYLVLRRQQKVMDSATRTATLVSALFPKTVRDRLYEQSTPNDERDGGVAIGSRSLTGRSRLQSFLADSEKAGHLGSEPIADLFPSATVMFLDLAGFTAWSSERDSPHVFTLLETIFNAFDEVAKMLGVFKVETIGDCYMAVAGLPQPRDDHAVVMAKFAQKCMKKLSKLTKELVVTLGPSTADMKGRCGLHSGPVTAGVLRGDKARFQLFGDTVNTASRMESSGIPDCIQASKPTADLLKAAGKETWLEPREDIVTVKGKGAMQTYWITTKRSVGSVASTKSSSTLSSIANDRLGDKFNSRANETVRLNMRLVEWNVKVLYSLLENLAWKRPAGTHPSEEAPNAMNMNGLNWKRGGGIVIDEIVEVVQLPAFDSTSYEPVEPIQLSGTVKDQLRLFVTRIAFRYRDVPFHNFEHASHVTMSAGKLMKRIVRPEGIEKQVMNDIADGDRSMAVARRVHEMTYGLSSDALTQFAVVFSALIHDVDHTGLPNSQLVSMGTTAAISYRNKSVAEQNSVDVAFGILMENEFRELRACICRTDEEMKRFRQVVVNAVIATDIADKDLSAMRRRRWDIAFSGGVAQEAIPSSTTTTTTTITRTTPPWEAGVLDQSSQTPPPQPRSFVGALSENRRATIVFEYIMQASDIAHTMQHWHTYRKWNERLFEECYAAWVSGRAASDPSLAWYHGELGFFDNYVIPLAEKLLECGVFGVSYHESLHYAMENRKEWEFKGEAIVDQMSSKCRTKFFGAHGGPGDFYDGEETIDFYGGVDDTV